MTDQQFAAWLKSDSAIRCVLMEVGVQTGGVETTRYLSNKGYVNGATDTPANTVYSPIIAGGIQFTESISLDGSASISFGDIELYNTSGERDTWMTDIWASRSVQMFIGDVSWARSDFRMIFNGVVAGINSKQRNRLNLTLSDKLQRLNTTVSDAVLGGTTSNAGKQIPLLFGECFNITPLLIDPTLLKYQVHNGPIESIIEVRDNGVPVNFTADVSTGTFTLNQQSVGTITCSAQGDKPGVTYANDVVSLVERLVTGYGQVSQRLTTSDLDTTSLTAFQTANPQPMGIYLDSKANVLDVCNQLTSSIGARLLMTRSGLLRIVQLNPSRTDSGTVVTESDIIEKSLYVASMPTVVAGVNIGYCKNWTTQAALQTGLPDADITLFGTAIQSVPATDSTAATTYKLFTVPDVSETMLLTKSDATAEATRRVNLFNIQRRIFHYTGLPQLLLEQLGNSQTIQNWRFGMTNGKTGQIVTVVTDWIKPSVEIEVII